MKTSRFGLLTKLILTLLVAVLFTGCSSSSESGTSQEGGTAEGEPTVLTVLLDQNDGYNKNFSPLVQGAYQMVQGFMYEPLVIFDNYNNNAEIMWLAEEIISEEDNRTLVIHVREGVKWSDGEEFNADDVIFSFEYSKDKPEIDKKGDWTEGSPNQIESIEKIDDYTVKLVMVEENRFHRSNVFTLRWMLPEHVWSTVEDPATYIYETDSPVVTGAFSEVVSFAPEMVVLGRNPHYWNAEELEVDQLKIPQFNSNDAALTLLQTGAVDWAHIFIPNIEDTYIKGDDSKKYWYGENDGVRIDVLK